MAAGLDADALGALIAQQVAQQVAEQGAKLGKAEEDEVARMTLPRRMNYLLKGSRGKTSSGITVGELVLIKTNEGKYLRMNDDKYNYSIQAMDRSGSYEHGTHDGAWNFLHFEKDIFFIRHAHHGMYLSWNSDGKNHVRTQGGGDEGGAGAYEKFRCQIIEDRETGMRVKIQAHNKTWLTAQPGRPTLWFHNLTGACEEFEVITV
eukprot:Hpha_TRINITY_DN16934_c0_g2::TRINITY_DN16934_c0_g2_i1::g.53266::m.53266